MEKEASRLYAELLAVYWLLHIEKPVNSMKQHIAHLVRAAEILELAGIEVFEKEARRMSDG